MMAPPRVLSGRLRTDSTLDLASIDGVGTTFLVGSGTSTTGAVRTYTIASPRIRSCCTSSPRPRTSSRVAVSGGYVAAATYTDGAAQIWRLKSICP
jgi:hypothetical protein